MKNRKRDKRDKIAIYARRCGLNRLLSHLPKRSLLLVLNYHRIGDPTDTPFDPGVFSATGEEFDQHIRLLKRHTRCVTLDDVIALVEHRAVAREPWSLVTFDDGYRDNYEHAFPILRSQGVQGVFFLPTSFINSSRLPWWDAIAYMVKNCRKAKLALSYPYPMEFSCENDSLRDVIRQILSIYSTPGVDGDLYMKGLKQACGITPPDKDGERCFLTWAEVAQMAAAGMALGAHSHRHEIMSKLTPEEQYREALQCKHSIEQHAGREVQAFAYPVGIRTSFSADTVLALKRAGYRAAFSFYGGVNMRSEMNPFDIRRCGVEGQIPSRFECQVLVTTVAARFWP